MGDGTGPPVGTLILLHGHDDDPVAFEEAAALLAGEWARPVVPRGPVPVGDRRSWWPSDEDGVAEPAAVASAIATLDELVREATPPVTVAGFSQGAALALLWATRETEPPADGSSRADALVACAGWLPSVEEVDVDPRRCRAARVLVVHGVDDEVVPLPLGRSVARLLERSGIDVTLVEVDAGHDLDPLAAAARAWLDGHPPNHA